MSHDHDETLITVQLMGELDKLIVEIRQRNKNTEILKEVASITNSDKGVSIIERANYIERAQQLRKSIYELEDYSKRKHMVQQIDDLAGELKKIKPVMPDPAYVKTYKRYELLMNNLDDILRSKKQIQAVISDLKMIRDELKQLQTAINKYGISIKESKYSPEVNEKERYLTQVTDA